jgi:4-amino-4-deoxy-L-arabinose transferase-like glycosyltransferase
LSEQRYYPFYLLFLCAVLFFPGLGARDFWAPVEPRYAEIARVMFITGEWIIPRVNGDLYTDKPILYFWLVLIASKVAGAVNEWTVRLPAAFGGVGCVLATYFVGRDFFSARIGLLAAAVLATGARVIWEARWAHIDALFCFFFLLSIYYAARALLRKGSPNEIFLAYVFMGLATLAKGLIGVVLPALLLVLFMIVRRDWRMIAASKLHLGVPIFLLVVAPWVYSVSAATGGKWLADFIYVQHFQRYTASAGHRQPFYYYFTTLPVDMLPWTIFALPALVAYRQYRKFFADPAKLFFALWFMVVFCFFSASDSKRDLYLMPLLPTVAVFIGCYIDDLAAGRLPQSPLYRVTALIFFGLTAIMGLSLPGATWFLRRDAFWISLPVAAVLTVGGSFAARYVLRKEPLKVVAATTVMMTAILLCAVLWVFPYVERYKSRRPFSLQVNRIVPSTATLYVYADTMNDFNYYTGREVIPVVGSRDELGELLAAGKDDYMLIKERDRKRIASIAREKIVATEAVGSTNWYLVALGNTRAGR